MPNAATDAPLTAALEAALLRELAEAWALVNATYFRRRLRPPLLELSTSTTHLGRWTPTTRTLEIARRLVLEHPWGAVLEVLKHEIAHQYVSEVLGELDTSPHGPAFRETCARLGIDAAATGVPSAAGDGESKVAARIAKLLALAESPNRHEAEAAMAAAQRLLLTHQIDLAGAKARLGYTFRHLGAPTGRTSEHERLLSLLLARHFFVEAIWVPVYLPRLGRRASVLEVCGTPENVAIAEYVHGFLLTTSERLWEDEKRRLGTRANRDRRRFLAGVMAGMDDKLARGAKKSASEGLVWVGDADLSGFFRARHRYVRHVRYAGEARTEAFARGREAGRQIVIHKGVGGAAESRGLLLPAGPRR